MNIEVGELLHLVHRGAFEGQLQSRLGSAVRSSHGGVDVEALGAQQQLDQLHVARFDGEDERRVLARVPHVQVDGRGYPDQGLGRGQVTEPAGPRIKSGSILVAGKIAEWTILSSIDILRPSENPVHDQVYDYTSNRLVPH